MTCNYDGAATSNAPHAPIAAGSNITAYYDLRDITLMPHIKGKIIEYWGHKIGPLMAYMARCPGDSCVGFDGKGAVWFKIVQHGLEPSAKTLAGPWYHKSMITKVTEATVEPGFVVTIPKDLKAGAYLIRHEVVNLEGDPAQFFPQCAQLMVTGEGTKLPSSDYLVSFPGAYKSSGKFFSFLPTLEDLLTNMKTRAFQSRTGRLIQKIQNI